MIRVLSVFLILFMLTPQSSEAFVFRKIVYCSPIEGQISWAGKPLANLTVTRFLRSGGFEDGENVDSTQTDAQGQFRFETVAERRLFRPDLLSANPHVSQSIEVNLDGQPYTVWAFQKQNFELGTEANGGVLKIECDLSKYEEHSYGRIVRCKHNGVQQYE